MTESLNVAVIGAGPSGLVTARELRAEAHRVTVFEKSRTIGGQWVYDPRSESDPLGQDPNREIIHSSMYESLRTNMPRPLMGFSGFGLSGRVYEDPRMFPGHGEVVAHIREFAREFGIEEVRFESEVVRVEMVEGRVDRWVVEWRRCGGDNGGRGAEEFDAVVVCNGHCTVPHLAHFPGTEKWPGKQIHSHNYRVPDPFRAQVVVMIGNGPSAYDISREISKVAKEVHMSSRSRPSSSQFSKLDTHDNIWLHSMIDRVCEDGKVFFEDGSSVYADTIFHCTGYRYEFEFLKTKGVISVDDNRVGPLYKHVFASDFAPWLSFVGLSNRVIIFGTMELQAKWVARALSKKVSLPSKEEMMSDVEDYYHQMSKLNIPKHLTHFFYPPREFEYLDWLAAQAGVAPVEDWKKDLYRKTLKRIQNHDDGFRDDPLTL